jgi:hypothetical protein
MRLTTALITVMVISYFIATMFGEEGDGGD